MMTSSYVESKRPGNFHDFMALKGNWLAIVRLRSWPKGNLLTSPGRYIEGDGLRSLLFAARRPQAGACSSRLTDRHVLAARRPQEGAILDQHPKHTITGGDINREQTCRFQECQLQVGFSGVLPEDS